ncbi:hypothetical protein [Yinghuangia soli]|uniref:Uncharacterized protein n=1 Tax=Yinghuangia soli TaxID=2908204 RepID=A0AA41Q480_9ACTN|nr:hypothetical protein [Yinghuangia soli]MCF2530690.1 hypothetical protein [Yinghuangia soli]
MIAFADHPPGLWRRSGDPCQMCFGVPMFVPSVVLSALAAPSTGVGGVTDLGERMTSISMAEELWGRLSVETQDKVDGLIRSGEKVKAIKLMRDSADDPVPGLPLCVELLTLRMTELGLLASHDGPQT